jgi:hypothetical protein
MDIGAYAAAKALPQAIEPWLQKNVLGILDGRTDPKHAVIDGVELPILLKRMYKETLELIPEKKAEVEVDIKQRLRDLKRKKEKKREEITVQDIEDERQKAWNQHGGEQFKNDTLKVLRKRQKNGELFKYCSI